MVESNHKTSSSVQQFVKSAGRRLNCHHAYYVAFLALLAFATCMSIIGIVYVLAGYAVPWQSWMITGCVIVGVGLPVYFLGRRSSDEVANYADDFYGLKDAVISCSHFAEEGRDGGFYDLQAAKTASLVNESNLNSIRFQVPWRIASCGLILLVVAIALGFKGPSEETRKRLESQQATLIATEIANRELEELIDELEKGLDQEEKELLEPDKLRKWVDELKKTKDRKEAMRQYARLEMNLNKAAQALSQRKDEKLLDEVAKELQKEARLKELAESLKQKKYEKANSELDDLKPERLKPKDLKNLSQKRKDLARLKAAAKRMANVAERLAARGSQNQSSGLKSNNDGRPSSNNRSRTGSNPSKNTAGSQPGDGNEQFSESSELDQMLEDLDEAVEDLDDEMEILQRMDIEDFEECEECENCRACEQNVLDELDRLGKKLRKMAKKRSAQAKLKSLSQKCSQCQASTSMMAQSKSPGGQKPGTGTSDMTREGRDPMIDNGQTTALKGQKGNGPSLTKLESADDGTGVSNRKSSQTKREFQRQVESFVQREDVPEELKTGVKNYFTNIHAAEEQKQK
ncbi:MAG: hypothetical protein AAF939_14180 [Planctomycetota bacterium]